MSSLKLEIESNKIDLKDNIANVLSSIEECHHLGIQERIRDNVFHFGMSMDEHVRLFHRAQQYKTNWIYLSMLVTINVLLWGA